MRNQPLSGIRVLDLSRLLPGPFCTLILGDMGADVIKVEDPRGGDYIRWAPPYVKTLGAMYLGLNRNKRSLAVNLKKDEGKELFRRLVQNTDVLLESFRPGVMDKLGLGYETLKQLNPGLIYCAISGYGQNGPYRLRAGHDLNYIGLGGALSLTGTRDQKPIPPGFQLADIGGGSLYATIGILAALRARDQTGEGQFLDISMTDGALAYMLPAYVKYFIDGQSPKLGGELLNGGVACFQVYETSDGKFMSLGALEPKFWQAFCKAVEREDLMTAQMAPTTADSEGYQAIVQLFKARTREEWTELFRDVDACCEPVLEIEEVPEHPQIAARELFFDSEHPTEGTLREVRTPVSDPSVPHRPAPLLGEQTRSILEELGLESGEIDRLLKSGVLAEKKP